MTASSTSESNISPESPAGGASPATTTQRPQPAAIPRRLRRVLCLDDFEIAAKKHLPRPIFGYIAGAAETNRSLHDNRLAFDEFGFMPRVLVDVSKRSQQTALLGRTDAAPFGIAPIGISALYAYRGDIVLARAAANVPMILSASSLIPLEDVRNEGKADWFQAYLPGDVPRITALVERVKRADFEILVITVDSQVAGNHENNDRAGFSTPLRPTARLAWDGISHPLWLFGTFLRTLLRHDMPHFENNEATRGPSFRICRGDRRRGRRAPRDPAVARRSPSRHGAHRDCQSRGAHSAAAGSPQGWLMRPKRHGRSGANDRTMRVGEARTLGSLQHGQSADDRPAGTWTFVCATGRQESDSFRTLSTRTA